MFETQYEALRRRGISRRSFLQFCSGSTAWNAPAALKPSSDPIRRSSPMW